jgi:hypothetical protein
MSVGCPPRVQALEAWSLVAMLRGSGTFKRWGLVMGALPFGGTNVVLSVLH